MFLLVINLQIEMRFLFTIITSLLITINNIKAQTVIDDKSINLIKGQILSLIDDNGILKVVPTDQHNQWYFSRICVSGIPIHI